jgi:hypothetical protein
MALFAENRGYPMFATLFGYGHWPASTSATPPEVWEVLAVTEPFVFWLHLALIALIAARLGERRHRRPDAPGR